MYASTKDSIPLMEQKGSASVVNLIPDDEFLKNPFGFDKGNHQFWDNVSLYVYFTFDGLFTVIKKNSERQNLVHSGSIV